MAVLAVSAAALAAGGGSGDPFFPLEGNRGYEVRHYSLRIATDRDADIRSATARLEARARTGLGHLHIDFRPALRVDSARIDGERAGVRRDGRELILRPRSAIGEGERFRVAIAYHGTPRPVIDPDGSSEGWIKTHDGAFVVGEPQGSPGWFPANDTPRDKATFRFEITTPHGITAIANGLLRDSETRGKRSTWVWRMRQPMAPYLATATTGRFDLDVRRAGGRPVYTAVDPREREGKRVLRRIPGMVRYFSGRFGRYPFDSIGAIVDHAPKVGYALETQSIPIFDEATGKLTLAHEIAHQWFGDAVTLRKWPQIWLHEGLAQWAQWAWRDHAGGLSLRQTYRSLYATPADKHYFWDPPPAAVGTPANLFDASVYLRGAIAVEALRERIGNRNLNEVLHRFYVKHRYGNSTIRQFISLAESVSGRDLERFFDDWLYERGKPRGYAPKGGDGAVSSASPETAALPERSSLR